MRKLRVLQVGMDPAVIDFSPWPGQDADHLRARINDAATLLQTNGFDVTVCLLSDGPDDVEPTLKTFLAGARFDVVEVGAGVRTSTEFTAIFERVINVVNALQPGTLFCFNDSPETTLEAIRRVLEK
ncbi:hypothetical protein [Glutamicibacter sp. X7]